VGLSPQTIQSAQDVLDIDPMWIPTTNQSAIAQAENQTQNVIDLRAEYYSDYQTQAMQGVVFFLPCAVRGRANNNSRMFDSPYVRVACSSCLAS
jgi:hypothetical protein